MTITFEIACKYKGLSTEMWETVYFYFISFTANG